jgi:hypothetical protein
MHRTFIFLLAVAFLQCGCANEPVAGVAAAPALAQQEQAEEQDSGIADKVAGLMQQAKSKAPSLDDMKKMLNDAGDSTSKTAGEALKQLTTAYEAARDQGAEHTENITEWVKDDWNGMSAWEYKIINVDSEDMANLETKLNEVGKQRWDCFHVSEGAGNTKFFMKRHRKSYLKNIPLKDLLILVPFLDNEK